MDVLHKPSKSDSKKKNRYHGMCLFIAVVILFTFTFSWIGLVYNLCNSNSM